MKADTDSDSVLFYLFLAGIVLAILAVVVLFAISTRADSREQHELNLECVRRGGTLVGDSCVASAQ